MNIIKARKDFNILKVFVGCFACCCYDYYSNPWPILAVLSVLIAFHESTLQAVEREFN